MGELPPHEVITIVLACDGGDDENEEKKMHVIDQDSCSPDDQSKSIQACSNARTRKQDATSSKCIIETTPEASTDVPGFQLTIVTSRPLARGPVMLMQRQKRNVEVEMSSPQPTQNDGADLVSAGFDTMTATVLPPPSERARIHSSSLDFKRKVLHFNQLLKQMPGDHKLLDVEVDATPLCEVNFEQMQSSSSSPEGIFPVLSDGSDMIGAAAIPIAPVISTATVKAAADLGVLRLPIFAEAYLQAAEGLEDKIAENLEELSVPICRFSRLASSAVLKQLLATRRAAGIEQKNVAISEATMPRSLNARRSRKDTQE